MPILQHYYTSYANRETGSAGFQVKAMSQGIPPDTQALILRLIAYRIPPTLDERNMATHPAALRYYYENPQRCFLLCSQSNGADDNGRPGNFFAHTLIMNPQSFKRVPPVLYWRSAFWRTRDSSASAILAPLPPEQMEPALDIEDIWEFLAQGKRLDYFYKLMCAVVHAHKSRRRIVIIDSAGNVAMWVAAVSAMLPPDYRPLLSFATYYHDPYQAQFMITGTTSDSSFRASAEEYMSFFVLNTEIDKVSDVEDSPYAAEAKQAAQSMEIYDSQMTSLFTLTITDDEHKQRFPPPEGIDEQLDQVALYAHFLAGQEQTPPSSGDLQAITTVLATFESSADFTREDVDEVRRLGNVLQDAWMEQGDQPTGTVYKRIYKIQTDHKIPTDKEVLIGLERVTQRTLNLRRERAQELLASLLQIYGNELLSQLLNGFDYWDWLRERRAFERATTEQLVEFWTCLGAYIRIGQNSEPFLLTSLQRLGNAWSEKNREESASLYSVISAAVAGREQELLGFAVEHNRQLPRDTVRRLYCPLVYAFDLDRRVPYRTLVQQVVPDIAGHELFYQITKGGMQNGLSEFERWIIHARRQRMNDIPRLVEDGLRRLYDVYQQSPEEWYRLASRILTSKALEPLPQKWEDQLVEVALSRVSLSRYTPADVEMCEKYRSREGIAADRRVVMNGLMAMKYGKLERELSEQLFKRFSLLGKGRPEQGREEARSFVRQFMDHVVKEPAHTLMVDAVFDWEYPKNFWQPYWDALHDIMAGAGRAEQAVSILGYWFASAPETFHMTYTSHYFFLHLPENVEEWRKERGFSDAVPSLMSVMSGRNAAWSPLVRDLLADRKNLLASAGQNIAAVGQGLAVRLRRSMNSEYAGREDEKSQAEERRREAFAANVAELFSQKNVRKAHLNGLQETYRSEQQEFFWECYWQQFTALLLSQDAMAVLDLLSFWFEDGYRATAHQFYLVPAFFLGFADAIEAARKERKFAEGARKINERGLKQSYPWYVLVEEYFMEPERRGHFSFRGHRP